MKSIPPEFGEKFNQIHNTIQGAHALERSRQIEAAQDAYLACLKMASSEHIPILEGQLVEIWMGIAFCHADHNDWPQALDWYHRAEAALQSSPEFHPDPKSPQARANAKKWTPHLPKGVQVIFQEGYPAKKHLATLYDSIALAYDNSGQLEQAMKYYQNSIDLHRETGNLEGEAQANFHQAVGFQRRQDWGNLAIASANMLSAASSAGIKPLILAASRLLAHSMSTRCPSS